MNRIEFILVVTALFLQSIPARVVIQKLVLELGAFEIRQLQAISLTHRLYCFPGLSSFADWSLETFPE